MKGMNGTKQPQILSRPRARRDAAKTLGIALQTRYRRLLEAEGENEIVVATSDLAQCMYENVEFVIWALKEVGGMSPPPPEELKRISANAAPPKTSALFAKPPEPVLQDNWEPGDCTCPPLEHGIIGRDKHMVSCPKFVP